MTIKLVEAQEWLTLPYHGHRIYQDGMPLQPWRVMMWVEAGNLFALVLHSLRRYFVFPLLFLRLPQYAT